VKKSTIAQRRSELTKVYKCLAVETRYWQPGTDYIQNIIDNVRGKIKNGDIVTVSEKAISTASGNILDESKVHSSKLAHFIAKYWMRYAWGYLLGVFCRFRKKTVMCLRSYPVVEGGAHKQVALEHAGFWQALMYGSEGGIDGSNLPYSYVSLPLKNARHIAERIREQLTKELSTTVNAMILDTDKTYSFRNFHFTPRPKPMDGIHSCNGIVAYLLGRFLKLKRRATPIAVVGCKISVEEALEIAELANRARGFGAGRNVWDMAEALSVSLTSVTWDMLNRVEHKPIVIVRRMES
jgi:F420-0:gamma-glutamyl ligase-like protein